MQDLQESLLDRRAAHLPSGDQSWWPAVEDIQGPESVLEGVGAGTVRSEELAQGAHLVCVWMEATVTPQGHLVPWGVVGEPAIQAARWMAAGVVEDPGTMVLMEAQGVPGWGEPCPNHSY